MGATEPNLDRLALRAQEDPVGYWAEAAEKVSWFKKWDQVMDDSQAPITKWFSGGELNLCFNCLDRHVSEGFGERTCLIFDSPVTDTRKEYSYAECLDQVSKLGSVLLNMGVKKGDVVMIYMPMIAEGIFSMLSCARIGAFHACIPSGLPAKDLATRIDHSRPKVIVMASHGFHAEGWKDYKEEADKACQDAEWKPEKILVFQRPFKEPVKLTEGRDLDWTEQMAQATAVQCVPMESGEPQFMVYTSGSTGVPKGIVHAVGPFTVRMTHDPPLSYGNWQDNVVVLGTSNIGWIAGHSVVVYGPLLAKIPTVIFEGDPLLTDDPRALYRTLSENQVTTCFARPGIFKILKGKDPEGKIAAEFDFNKLDHVIAAGERIDGRTMEWVMTVLNASVWNGWGQSETCTLVSGFPDRSEGNGKVICSPYGPVSPGWKFHVRRPDGDDGKPGELGRILMSLPLPPGGLLTIFGKDDLCRKNYFTEYPGFYDTKDEGYLNEKGHLRIESRIDDIMKVGQVYLAAQAVEEVVLSHPSVADCIVVSTTDLIWKEIPLALYTKKSDTTLSEEEIYKEVGDLVEEKFGSSIKFAGTIQVAELPVTRTGKVHRPSCNALARGKDLQTIATGAVENPYVLENIMKALKEAGFGRDVLVE